MWNVEMNLNYCFSRITQASLSIKRTLWLKLNLFFCHKTVFKSRVATCYLHMQTLQYVVNLSMQSVYENVWRDEDLSPIP
jgi:hypothetical protein